MLEKKILQEYKEAMKHKDAVKSSTLSFLRAEMINVAIAKKKKLLAVESKNKGIEQTRSKMPYTHFPPYLSVRIPAGKRKIAPVSTGIPINHPIFTGPQSKTWLLTKKVTNTPFSIHTAKHTVKASVLKKSMRWDFAVAICSIQFGFLDVAEYCN